MPRGKSDVLIVVLLWAIEDYVERLSSSRTTAKEETLRKDFPPLYTAENGQLLPLQEDPCVVVDSRGIIILWYMPSSFSSKRNVSCIDFFLHILTKRPIQHTMTVYREHSDIE